MMQRSFQNISYPHSVHTTHVSFLHPISSLSHPSLLPRLTFSAPPSLNRPPMHARFQCLFYPSPPCVHTSLPLLSSLMHTLGIFSFTPRRPCLHRLQPLWSHVRTSSRALLMPSARVIRKCQYRIRFSCKKQLTLHIFI